jgi:serine/threonine protein kinase
VVYEAEHLPSARRVALKVLSRVLDSSEHRRRFLREGRLAASVNHPNSVYIFGTEEIDGSPAIAMELVPGGTLQQRVKEQGPLPVTEAVDVTLQIIAGLEAAQAVGVLHRDVKPANCFLDTHGSVKIGDFGLSISTSGRDESYLTAVGSILGTPAFSSPEQLRGDELNVRSDIYSVGVTLYYLLTGHTPFACDDLVKLLVTVLEQPAPSPQQCRPEIPSPLARAVLRCLEKQPEKRFGTYEELRQALVPFSLALWTTR